MNQQLSIVIATRNDVSTIRMFLASIPQAAELVVVDASVDSTSSIIRSLRPRNTRIIHTDAPLAQARQIGADAARGEWLLFSDAKVRFATDYFALLASRLHGDVLYGAKIASREYTIYNHWFAIGQAFCQRIGLPAASGSNMLVRRAVFVQVSGFRLDLPVNTDSELPLRLKRLDYRVAFLPELEVYTTDDRQLMGRPIRKMANTIVRCGLIAVGMRIVPPRELLRHGSRETTA